ALVYGQTPEGEMVSNPYAADYLRGWAKAKFGAEIPLEHVQTTPVRRIRDELLGYQEKFLKDGQLEKEIDALLKANPEPEKAEEAFRNRFGPLLRPEELQNRKTSLADLPHGSDEPSLRDKLIARARQALRQELTDLEQFVLIQIFDQTWKDHLYAMDMLKGSVGLVGFAEQDPRIVYKKEGYEYFKQMMVGVRDKVTDLIFRARIVGAQQARSAYRETAAVHEEAGGYGVGENLAATAGVEKGQEVHTAEEAQAESGGPVATKTIVRETP